MMGNAFYFMLEALFVLWIFKFLSLFFGHIRKGFDKKLRLISKFMTSQTGKQIIAIHILSNISRSKSNQTVKFGQLIEYNMKSVFHKNHAESEVGRLVPDLFLCF